MTNPVSHASLESWERHTQAGFRALSCGLWREAADAWLQSLDDARSVETWDARLAAAMNNSGIACLLDSRWAAAKAYFDKARETWTQVQAHIPELEVPIVGRSSAFHFRLATRHEDAFAASRRRRCAVLCKAAAAITDFNAGLAARHTAARSSSPRESTSAIVRALVDAFGPRCPEIQLIGDDDDNGGLAEVSSPGIAQTDALYGAKAQRVFELQARSMAAALSADYRRLEMATNLTALMSPRLLRARTASTPHLDGSEQ